ncbi:MAG: tandem-95 repeat protein [Pirellulales bacterium]|nr:tandem-95 repeat protein [Pirellulales bacterium]
MNDGKGGQDTATVTITITGANDTPDAGDDGYSMGEDDSLPANAGRNLLANDTDPDTADALAAVAETITSALGVSVTIHADGTFVYDPGATFNGLSADDDPLQDTFSYTVDDGQGGQDTATVTITITGANDAPVAVDDGATVANNRASAVDVLANDSDPDEGDEIVIDSFTQGSQNGTVILSQDGKSLVYTPVDLLGGEGQEMFSYTIRDASGATSTAVVTVTVVANAAPVAEDDAGGTTDEDTLLSAGGLLDNDHDDDPGDIFIVTGFDPQSNLGAAVSVDVNGNFTYDPRGADALQGLPENGSVQDFFYYTISDGNGGFDTAKVTITVTGVNDAPVAQDDAFTTGENDPLPADTARKLLDNDDDVDLTDTISVVAETKSSGAGATVVLHENGTFSYDPGALFDYLSADDDPVQDTFTYTVTDGKGGSSTATVTITITGANDDPVAHADAYTITEDESLPANAGRNLLDNDADPDAGATLTAVAETITSTLGVSVTIHADGTFSYDPGATFNYLSVDDDPVEDTFSYTLIDGHGGSDVATVTITITGANDAPTADDQTAGVTADAELTGNVLAGATDPDTNDVLTAVPTTGVTSKGVTFSVLANGQFTYDPRGVEDLQELPQDVTAVDEFSFTVTDGHGGFATAKVTITVTGVNDAPSGVDDAYAIGEDESLPADAGRNLLSNDLDPDEPHTLSAVAKTISSFLGAAVTINADGTFSYDPGTLFNHLAANVEAYDSFTYTVVDEYGAEDSSATVTITITGANDDPVGVDDDGRTTGESTAIDIDVLANDWDPDDEASLSVSGVDATSNKGAAISINPDGTIHYDPSASSELAALAGGQSVDDTFSYTVSDGLGGTSTATVTVEVVGQGTAPVVVSPIDDMLLADGDSQPELIDLRTVFNDVEGDDLIFSAASSNTDLATVEIVGGTHLRVTYLAYAEGQDHTPATITVTATEDTPAQLQATDSFTVAVSVDLVNVYLVVRETASASGTTTTLPGSISEVAVGSEYVVEVWIQDLYTLDLGLTGARLNVWFDTTVADGKTLHFDDSPFNFVHTGTIENTTGVVNGFGGGYFPDSGEPLGTALAPSFGRLGYVTFEATTQGVQELTLEIGDPPNVVTRVGGGTLDLSKIHLGTATVEQVADAYTFNVLGFESNFTVTEAMILGAAMTASPPGVNQSYFGGSLNIVVDNLNNPTQFQITSGLLDAREYPGGDLSPGIGGTAGSAPGDLSFVDVATGNTQMAIRDLTFNVVMENPLPFYGTTHTSIGAINVTVATGFIDYRSPGGGGARYNISGAIAVEDDNTVGYWNHDAGTYQLDFTYTWIIDLSSLVGANSHLTIGGYVNATYQVAPLMGTQTGESETDEGTGVYVTLSKEPTSLGADGRVDALPQSEAWIDEWTGYWVEVWVRTDNLSGVRAATVDLAYNRDYFTATQIEHAGVFVENVSGDVAQDGLVRGLGGATTLAGVGADGYVLLGRVRFESLDGDNVPIDADSQVITPHDLGLTLGNLQLELVDGQAVEPHVGKIPKTELWAVPYDVDDNGSVDLGDLSFFVPAYGQDVVDSQTPFVWSMDYDRSGNVNLGDLSYFVVNYCKSKAGGQAIAYPDTFLRRWIGAGLDVQGDTPIGELLDAAIDTWTERLGLTQRIDVQLVVKDFGTSQLGEGQILEVDEEGVPIRGRVTLDDDAAGLGWYSQLDASEQFEQYDLYTVLLHEIGHTLGFTSGYEGFASHVETDGQGNKSFVAEDLDVALDAAAQHLASQTYGDDLMSPLLAPGVRKLPSDLDVRILLAAYEAAEGGAGGFAPMAAAMHAGNTLIASHSTAEQNATLDRLDGDVTWDRLLTRASQAGLPTLQTVNANAVDAICAAAPVVLDETTVPRPGRATAVLARRVVASVDADASADDLAALEARPRDDRPAVDALWAQWDNPWAV